MKFTASFFSIVAVLCAISVTVSCSQSNKLAGTWEGNPSRIIVTGADDATSTMALSFTPSQNSKKQGDVMLNATINLRQAVQPNTESMETPWEVSVAATANIKGQYVMDDDDILLSLDPSTMRINVDPDGVAYVNNAITGMEQPQLDSLTAATTQLWNMRLTAAMHNEFGRYTKLDDVEIHNNTIMSVEINDHDVTMRRVDY